MKTQSISINKIDLASSPVMRQCGVDLQMAEDYAAAMRAGEKFPPVSLFKHEDRYVVADGRHRVTAVMMVAGHRDVVTAVMMVAGHRDVERLPDGVTITAEVHPGGPRECTLYAAGANASHGLRRTAEDKRLAVGALLADEEWRARSNAWIAEVCHVSGHLVAAVRREACPTSHSRGSTGKRIGKDGKARPAEVRPKGAAEAATCTGTVAAEEAPEPKSGFTYVAPPLRGDPEPEPAPEQEVHESGPDKDATAVSACCEALAALLRHGDVWRSHSETWGRWSNRKGGTTERAIQFCPFCGFPQERAE